MTFALPLEVLNNIHWLWFGLVIFFLVIEGLTLSLTTIWLAISALFVMVLSFFIPSLTWQIIIFLLISILLLIFTRPFAVSKMKLGKTQTNVDQVIGKEALVLSPISYYTPGQVKAFGQVWTAKVDEVDQSFEKEDICIVDRIEGVSLYVKNKK